MVQLLEPSVSVLTLQAEEEYRLCAPPTPEKAEQEMDFWITLLPEAWAETLGQGLAIAQPPVVVALKTTAPLIQVRQYPMSKKARESTRHTFENYSNKESWSNANQPGIPHCSQSKSWELGITDHTRCNGS